MSLEFELPLVSVFFILLIMIVYFLKKKVNLAENKMYSIILWCSFFAAMIDTVCHFVCAKFSFDVINGELYQFFNYSNKVMSILYVVIFSCLLFYTILISFKKQENVSRALKCLIIYNVFFAILVQFTKIELVPMQYVTNVKGDTILVAYIFIALLLFMTVFLTIKKFVKGDKRYYAVFLILSVLGILYLMTIFLPEMIIYDLALAIFCYIMYFTIENPDVKMIQQLELAKDAADKANAAKTDFLSSMSHEIRTPLNAIVGFSDCIKNSENLSEAKENADDIINASNTLLEIVNGILDISKIEAGKLEIINSNYNASNLFSGLAKLMTPKMNEKGLDFQVTIAPDLPNVLYGDSANIKKVVTNLLSNAYKYTDSGFVKYDVKCVNANGVCRLIITVTDSGRGIKKESIDKLFTKFQRVDEDRNTTIEGTGLGLAITKQLVELMGGNVVVDSTYGEGSKFTITLDQRIENVEVVEEKNSVVDTIDLTGKKILVVDDNSINLKVAKKLLERYKATVEVCDSGFKCVELIDSGALFDLILMDDMMPKMSGTQTLQKLKEKESFKIPVFALTANAITGMKERYLSAGFDSYLAKPIEKEAMIDAFNKLFNKKKTEVVEETTDVEKTSVVDSEASVEEPVVEEKEITDNITANKEDIAEDVVLSSDESFVKNVEYLKSNNIDVDHGLELLGDIELYNDTMNDFIDEVNNRLPLLAEYKNNSDMPNYAILVHAIKSDCKYLGIMALADINYEHELKSKANDVEFVNANYDSLISEINKYLDICKKYIGRD